jgi:glycosyltransferase involved in cell wall biosynthesis
MNQGLEILIPAYNEEGNIAQVIEKSIKFLKKHTNNYSVLVVDDGSTDNTGKILDKLKIRNKNLRVIHHKKNLGIGHSWYDLYSNSSKNILLTCPADQQFDPKDFEDCLPLIAKADVVSIYRVKKQDYSLFRKFLTFFNKTLIRVLFGLNLKDINWVKIYRRSIFEGLNIQLRSPLIESEILAKAKKRNLKIVEISAPYYPRVAGKSKGSNFKNVTKSINELFSLFFIIYNFK